MEYCVNRWQRTKETHAKNSPTICMPGEFPSRKFLRILPLKQLGHNRWLYRRGEEVYRQLPPPPDSPTEALSGRRAGTRASTGNRTGSRRWSAWGRRQGCTGTRRRGKSSLLRSKELPRRWFVAEIICRNNRFLRKKPEQNYTQNINII